MTVDMLAQYIVPFCLNMMCEKETKKEKENEYPAVIST